ncbi:MAG: hypothetical protein JWM89_1863 [Acidimicrobiales bacterium]|nr:hypothetical protein [Acidimicrobiales bacterium]
MIRVHPTAPELAGGDGEDGFTLIETLVAIVLMGLVFAAIMSSILTATKVTHDNRDRALADRYGRILAEQLKGVDIPYAYTPCAHISDYPGLDPTQYSKWRVTVESVEYWVRSSGSTATDTYGSTCNATTPDTGIQRITILARPPVRAYRSDVTSQRVVVIKRDTRSDCHVAVQPQGLSC